MDEQQEQIQAALNRAFFFLKFRPRSEKEVFQYLEKKGEKFAWTVQVIEQVILKLKDTHFIDDKNFIEWFVHQRSTGKPKSKFALGHELQRFGVDKDLIAEFFDENPVQEDSLALSALERKWHGYEYLDKKERFKKAASFLLRRGFTFDTIKKTIQHFEEK